MDPTPGGAAHASAEELAAYLDGGLSPEDRARLSDHLADCDVCRAEVVETGRLLPAPSTGGKLKRVWLAAAGTTAAAAVLIFLLLPPGSAPTGELDTLRSPEVSTRDARELVVVEPLADASVAHEGLTFVWNRGGAEASYRFTLADEAGAPLWSVSTGDTLLVLPDDVELVAGRSYLWRVDALFADGQTATSTVHRLTVVP